jgi:hypothetical protein
MHEIDYDIMDIGRYCNTLIFKLAENTIHKLDNGTKNSKELLLPEWMPCSLALQGGNLL